MLRNELYIGRVIWNRSQYVKQPETNKRVRRMRPESEWKIFEKPELRIIDESLWGRVQERLSFVGQYYNYGNRPGLAPRSHTSPNLLTGLMQCGVCGANLTVVAGRGKHLYPKYGCPQNANRGACANDLKERADVIEERLFFELQNAVLQPEAIDHAVREFERQLQSSLSGLDHKIGRMRQRASEIEVELGNLIRLAAKCEHSPSLIEGINRLEQERKEITGQLLNTEPNSISAEIGRIRQFVAGQMGNVRQLLKADVQKAKVLLKNHVSGIRMVPQPDGGKGHYVAEGEWNLLGGYGEKSGNPGAEHVRMVAGEGFEPSTFGL